jgi:hypothetical protein
MRPSSEEETEPTGRRTMVSLVPGIGNGLMVWKAIVLSWTRHHMSAAILALAEVGTRNMQPPDPTSPNTSTMRISPIDRQL